MSGTEVVEKKEDGAVEQHGMQRNFFEQYGSEASSTQIVGQLLKFSKGDWLVGADADEVPVGTRLVALMDDLQIGWLKWVDGKPASQVLGRVAEGYSPPRRKELGDDDESEWELDDTGKARDPWQFSNYLTMRKPGLIGTVEDEDAFTFTTSSRGGINVVGELCKQYGKQMRSRPDEYPIVELSVDSYKHPNPQFGRIKVPVMKIVAWEPKVPAAPLEKLEAPVAEKPAAKVDTKKKR